MERGYKDLREWIGRYYRNNPIILGSPPSRPSGKPGHSSVISSALVWDELGKAGIPDVKGVWKSEWAGGMFMTVSIKQRYPGHAKQAGLVAMGAIQAHIWEDMWWL